MADFQPFIVVAFGLTAMQVAAIIKDDRDGWQHEPYRATHKAAGTIVHGAGARTRPALRR